MSEDVEIGARPGRPRSEKTRLAILDAAADLLLSNGFSEATIEAIAARAGVSKVTIYKWWPSRGAVAIDAYFHRFIQSTIFPDSGNTVVDITTQVLHLIETFRGRAGEVMAELLGQAQLDPALKRRTARTLAAAEARALDGGPATRHRPRRDSQRRHRVDRARRDLRSGVLPTDDAPAPPHR